MRKTNHHKKNPRDISHQKLQAGGGTNANGIPSTSPQGFDISIDPQTGAWQQLVLAQNTVDSAAGMASLQFQPPSAVLQGALQSNQLFLVVSYDNGTALTNFSNEIGIEGWPFKLDVPGSPRLGSYRNVLIFKFCHGSLVGNLQDIPGWHMPETFNNTGNNGLQNLSMWLQNYIRAAMDKYADQQDQDYAHFCTIVNDPMWTGVIALAVDIDVQHVPQGLQAPLSGIDSSLFYAHHFGFNANPVTGSASTQAPQPNNSLFGLIDYEDQPPAPHHNTTLQQLKIAFINSKISNYNIAWSPPSKI